ncbi:exported hypothetical protein [Nostocoides japonicum T1-X7]|uniref:Uncharacterized protein n=1 Tax=Nostocoides japonicum T1-X7 TaxID=1194083 RepID=A0A077M516_9MICO|nr:exported hypothetical protein [Tetrasphaera japonica T1-X7]
MERATARARASAPAAASCALSGPGVAGSSVPTGAFGSFRGASLTSPTRFGRHLLPPAG